MPPSRIKLCILNDGKEMTRKLSNNMA